MSTSFVRFTFAGKVLPDYVELHGLLLPIRLSTRKAMFCDKCLQMNHTAKMCANKPVCAKCNETHTVADFLNINPETSCKLCSENHPTGDINCPKRIRADQSRSQKMKSSPYDILSTESDETMANTAHSTSQAPPHFQPSKESVTVLLQAISLCETVHLLIGLQHTN